MRVLGGGDGTRGCFLVVGVPDGVPALSGSMAVCWPCVGLL